MKNRNLTVNCLLSFSFLAALFFIGSCASSGSSSTENLGPSGGRMTDDLRPAWTYYGELIPADAFTPAPVIPSKDPNVKNIVFIDTWDFDTDSQVPYADTSREIDISTDPMVAPEYRILRTRGKARIGMLNNSSFDAVTLNDLKNAQLFEGGFFIEPPELGTVDYLASLPGMFIKALDIFGFIDKMAQLPKQMAASDCGPGEDLPLKEGSLLAVRSNGGKYVKIQVTGWEPKQQPGYVDERYGIKLQYVIYPK